MTHTRLTPGSINFHETWNQCHFDTKCGFHVNSERVAAPVEEQVRPLHCVAHALARDLGLLGRRAARECRLCVPYHAARALGPLLHVVLGAAQVVARSLLLDPRRAVAAGVVDALGDAIKESGEAVPRGHPNGASDDFPTALQGAEGGGRERRASAGGPPAPRPGGARRCAGGLGGGGRAAETAGATAATPAGLGVSVGVEAAGGAATGARAHLRKRRRGRVATGPLE